MNKVILILYTTQYRKGGQKFRRVAETMAAEKTSANPDVICSAVESKAAITAILKNLKDDNKQIDELHFIGHSGMYGPMFGTTAFPEQFSPYEIRHLDIPFAPKASAYFHCCRSARWFAPYFSRHQKVKTFGYHWYTTFSSRRDRYRFPNPVSNTSSMYCFGCPGKKSHGYIATLKKLLGLMKAEPLKAFNEVDEVIDSTYNQVADLYAQTFTDIKVRRDEINWLKKHLSTTKVKVLDIGCGNGALLKEIQGLISEGVGVDVSSNLLTHAKVLNEPLKHISFQQIQGPTLPFETDSFDLVISMLSFRYLDWDPIMLEIERVLKQDGKLLVIDMVTAPVKWNEMILLLKSKVNHYLNRMRNPLFYKHLKTLVEHPKWAKMLHHNPIRSQHEMKWYLESRFPKRKIEIINIGMHSRILAFDSIDMKNIKNINLSYP